MERIGNDRIVDPFFRRVKGSDRIVDPLLTKGLGSDCRSKKKRIGHISGKEKIWRWNCQNCILWTGSGGVGEGREKCTLIIERSKTNHFDNCPWKLNDIKLLVEMKLISDILKEICVIFLFEGISRPVGLDVLWVRVFSFRYVLVC